MGPAWSGPIGRGRHRSPGCAQRHRTGPTVDSGCHDGAMRGSPTVLHLDLDAFYAAVEQRDKPSLRGRPVVVGGIGGRGVVATASYEARLRGVRSAMPTAEARARCPHAAYLAPRFAAYKASSDLVMTQLHELSPLLFPGGRPFENGRDLRFVEPSLRHAGIKFVEGMGTTPGGARKHAAGHPRPYGRSGWRESARGAPGRTSGSCSY